MGTHDVLIPDNAVAPAGRRVRHRLNLNATVHEDTLGRLDELAEKFQTSRGQLLDKIVQVLHTAYRTGKVMCVHGAQCVAGRTDLPEIF